MTITGADPPVGLTGDYHIALPTGAGRAPIAALVSPIIDRGARCTQHAVRRLQGRGRTTTRASRARIEAPNVDYDGQSRPQLRRCGPHTRWDLGADELRRYGAMSHDREIHQPLEGGQ